MRENSAFLSGFRKGLAAPFSLFAPKVEREPLELKQVKTNVGGWESDWAKLGGDMQRAMGYVAKAAQ
jgi:hypothetical protein